MTTKMIDLDNLKLPSRIIEIIKSIKGKMDQDTYDNLLLKIVTTYELGYELGREHGYSVGYKDCLEDNKDE